jgi:tungstate transport system ATP-binding protein
VSTAPRPADGDTSPAPPRLAARGVRVERDGRVVLRVPELTVPAEEVLVLIGPNGAGKSTLLQALGLLIPLADGTIHLDGRPVVGRAAALAARRRMAMAFQEPLLFDTTVAGNVAAGLRLHGHHRATIESRVAAWLDALGIAHLARRRASALSGGEAQRVSLARALALDPDILLLDEPFAALDAATRASLLSDVERLVRRPGRAVVIVTHDRAEALRLADRIAVVLDGQIAQIGAPAAVFGRPASLHVAEFVGVETILPGRVVATEAGLATVAVGPHRVVVPSPLPVGQRVHVCVRPEDIALAAPGPAESVTSVRNHLPGVVSQVVPQGPIARVEIDAGVAVIAYVTGPSVDALQLRPGAPVVASVKATDIHLIPSAAPEAPVKAPLAATASRTETGEPRDA